MSWSNRGRRTALTLQQVDSKIAHLYRVRSHIPKGTVKSMNTNTEIANLKEIRRALLRGKR